MHQCSFKTSDFYTITFITAAVFLVNKLPITLHLILYDIVIIIIIILTLQHDFYLYINIFSYFPQYSFSLHEWISFAFSFSIFLLYEYAFPQNICNFRYTLRIRNEKGIDLLFPIFTISSIFISLHFDFSGVKFDALVNLRGVF